VTGDVDLDRLADYVGGALDGTPDEATVAHLIATDTGWARAHAALVAADASVRADLGRLAGEPESVPADVLARLDAALAAEPPLGGQPSTGSAAADSRPRLTVLPGGRGTPTASPARRQWRTVVGVAAGVVVLGLGAVSLLPHLSGGGMSDATTTATNESEGGSAPLPPRSDTTAGDATGGVTASGSDYNPDTLATLAGGASIGTRGEDSPKTNSGPHVLGAPSPTAGPTEVPEALRRLTAPDVRAACIKAIVAQYGGTATLLDYARYQGSPALIVLLDGARGAAGRKWVVAVGPKCGTAGTMIDQRYSTPVG
jgi:hypothetical protein